MSSNNQFYGNIASLKECEKIEIIRIQENAICGDIGSLNTLMKLRYAFIAENEYLNGTLEYSDGYVINFDD